MSRIEASLERASDHSLARSRISDIVERICDALYSSGPVVSSTEIGQAVLEILSHEDYRAYARYALQLVRPASPTDFLRWLEQEGGQHIATSDVAPFRISHDNGVQEDADRRALHSWIREQTQFRREEVPEATIDEVTEVVLHSASNLAMAREHPVVSDRELAVLVADALRAVDELSYFYCAIVAKDLNTNTQLMGELRAMIDQSNVGSAL